MRMTIFNSGTKCSFFVIVPCEKLWNDCAMNARTTRHKNKRTVVLVGFEGASALDITGPYEVFAAASTMTPESDSLPYRVMLLADQAGPLRTASGLCLVADESWRDYHDKPDTLLIAGGPDVTPLIGNDDFLEWLKGMAEKACRIGSVCTGAFALADAGLLDGRRATTHWDAVERLAGYYPQVSVEPDSIFVKDGNIYTSAGVTAGMDLALALVEEDLGRQTALAVARQLVMFLKRPGGQSQFSSRLQAQAIEGSRLSPLLSWLAKNYRQPLNVEEMASRTAMSKRTFCRIFVAETGVTPAYYLERLRLEHAVSLLEASGISLDATAKECGFSGDEQLRRAFRRHRGITPQEYRDRFYATD
ncbi:GlxA family transcriptional regulator [Citrifermentans pelophilum]|uniref:GlxA family transcriptional regulator n=1 Tax=Geoanaerobacter pelophilus TaxID=60036 RepID=UPI001F3C7BCC|nr:GlxA family transcriptional regulator [Geoanaerobacter pelophilus]